ncbi:MAG: hypothetical protein ACRDZO_20990 [Egibacteraceae bacterium]
MTDVTELVARSGDLKRELVAFGRRPRFAKAFRATIGGAGDLFAGDEDELIGKIDSFVLRHRLADGRTVIDHFVAARRDLSEQDREMLLSWRDPVDGMFEVQRRDGDALVLHNLIDELTYRTHSNVGTAVFARMPRRSFMLTRVVPVGEDWLLSGCQSLLPASARAQVAKVVADLCLSRPALVFRNPEKLERGWELQRQERARFVEFFGADLVVLPAEQMREQLLAYSQDGTRRAAGGEQPLCLEWPLPGGLGVPETIGAIYDEVEGLGFFADFGLVAEAFANPERATRQPYRRTIQGYLRDGSVSPLPFRRLADQDPGNASRVFQLLLKRPSFTWAADGEALLRRRKAAFFDKPSLPSIIPIGGIALEHYDRVAAGHGGRGPKRHGQVA